MRTLTILKLECNQSFPHPFSRASSPAEAAEIITSHAAARKGLSRSRRDDMVSRASVEPEEFINLKNIDTEEPVCLFACKYGFTFKFYIFTEE